MFYQFYDTRSALERLRPPLFKSSNELPAAPAPAQQIVQQPARLPSLILCNLLLYYFIILYRGKYQKNGKKSNYACELDEILKYCKEVD